MHVKAPYPDYMFDLSSIWMLTDFTVENKGTHFIPGSHNTSDNPAAGTIEHFDHEAPYPTEIHACGRAGSVLLCDSRLWHAVALNASEKPRIALAVRYAPWWLNLNPTITSTSPWSLKRMARTTSRHRCKRDVLARLPQEVKPLYNHFVED